MNQEELLPRSRLTVDFGEQLLSDISERAEILGITNSQLVRRGMRYALDNMSDDKYIEETTVNRKRLTRKEAVSKLVDTYNEVFFHGRTSPPPQFYPALYKVYNAAVKGGLSPYDLCDLVRAAPHEQFVSQQLRNGDIPSLPYLLSAGMIPRIMVVAHRKREKEKKLSESEFVEYKYDLLEKHFPNVDPEVSDEFRDKLMDCQTQEQAQELVKQYAS